MNQLSVLEPFSKPKENNSFHLNSQIGGAMEFLDEWGSEIIESAPKAASNATVTITEAITDLFKQDVLPSQPAEKEANQSKTQIGGKTELRFDQKEKELKEKARVEAFKKDLSQAQNEIMAKQAREKALEKQRENVIKTIGGITNLSYTDVMDNQGNMRLDVESWFNKKNSEMAEAEIKKQKQLQVKKATGKIDYFMQQNMAGERAGGQHVMSAVG